MPDRQENPSPIPKLPLLSSPQNDRVKTWVKLRKNGIFRQEKKWVILEGKKAVECALNSGNVRIQELVFSDHLLGDDLKLVEAAHQHNISLTRVSKVVFKKISDVKDPQGIAAVTTIPSWSIADFLHENKNTILVAAGIQDPGNLGTLIRSGLAAGCAGLIGLENTVDPFNTKVVRATAGGILSFPVVRVSLREFLAFVEKENIKLVAANSGSGTPYQEFNWVKHRTAICIGSEGLGLPAELENRNIDQVLIEMEEGVESLNAAVAASILLFEALSQRKRRK